MAIRIPAMDLMFFLMETPQNPKHVGALQIFQLPEDAPKDYLSKLVTAYKKVPVGPPFNYRPYFPRTGMPQWRVDKDLDIDFHVRHSAVPGPGSNAQLMQVVERLHGSMFDRRRPGWICQIIEGLEGNRFAIYSKIHHAYIDGMSGVKRMYGSLSSSADDTRITPGWAYDTDRGTGNRRSSKTRMLDRARSTGKVAIAQAKAVAELYESFAKMGLQMLKLRESHTQIPFTAPRTLMNRHVDWDSRSIGVCTLPLDRVREVGASMGGKVNDVVLTLVDAALHDYLDQRQENIDEALVALCPMSLREAGDDAANTQVATLHVRMGEPQADIRNRLQQVIDSASAAKQEARAMSRNALMDYVLLLAGAMELLERSGLDQAISPSYNVLVSNVPGPDEDRMYMAGSRLLASYPMSTLTPGVNLNVTVLSHGNRLDFGLLADRHAIPELETLVGRIEKRFSELERLLIRPGRKTRVKATGKKTSGPKRKPKPKAKARTVANKPKKSPSRRVRSAK